MAPAQGKAWKATRNTPWPAGNIGAAPHGYLTDRVPHPAPAKAAQGRTRSRLILDPARAPVVGQIYTRRVVSRLPIRAITGRLNAAAAYPPPTAQPG